MKIKSLLAGFAAAVAFRRARRGRRRHLLQLPARVGRLGHHAQVDQGGPQARRSARQQELRADAVDPDRRQGEPGGRHRLLRRDLRHQGRRGGSDRALHPQVLQRDSGRPQGARRQLVHHPLRHHRLLRERRRAARRAGAEGLEGPAQARVRRPGGLPRPDQRRRGLRRGDRGQPRARRHYQRLGAGHQVLQGPEEEPPDRAAADLVRARALGRNPDHVRLRLQHAARQVQGQVQLRVRDSRRRAPSCFPT